MKKTLLPFLLLTITTLSFGQTWEKVSAGTEFTLGLKSDSSLWAFGANLNGQLGQGDINGTNSPVKVGTNNDWIDISAGGFHVIALKADSTLWGWGGNTVGQLGQGTTSQMETLPVQIGTATNWSKIVAGQAHNLAIKNDGTLWAWGFNYAGQIGDSTTNNALLPTQVGTDTDWMTVSAGGSHSHAIKTNGKLWSWGINANGQLGVGSNIQYLFPTLMDSVHAYQKVSSGFEFSIALRSDNTIWSWGFNANGQLGDGTNTEKNAPVQIGTDSDWSIVEAGSSFAFGIKQDKTLYGWGYNGASQLGTSGAAINVPTQIGTNTDWIAISASEGATDGTGLYGAHSVGLKSSKNFICTTGANYIGQLGDSTQQDHAVFTCDVKASTLGLNDLELVLSKITISPNPSTGLFKIEMHDDANDAITFTIQSATGKEVYQGELNGYSTSINLSKLAKGIYFLQFKNIGNQNSRKIIIQ